ncbi:carotenoid ester lipase precursor [Lactarius sanguifluus]|nr:carotenoid ester lipase precursor [Lactarius sanguifluus]
MIIVNLIDAPISVAPPVQAPAPYRRHWLTDDPDAHCNRIVFPGWCNNFERLYHTRLHLPSLRNPQVNLDDATLFGIVKGETHQFLGIPFAYPPTGDRRLRQPQPLPPYEGYYHVQAYGKSCPQQGITLPDVIHDEPQVVEAFDDIVNKLYSDLTPDDEDCLTVNVIKPAGATPGSKYPVLVWIYGGGFEIGGPSTYDGGKQPVIYVSIGYRLGFLIREGSQERRKVGNLGLQDQRLALKWVQTYISAFGGDPSKVTIWGESAGAISVALQMITNGGNNEGLFRGAVMQSGGPIPVGNIEHGQQYYDFIVQRTGCESSPDTLSCIRKVPYATFKKAMDESPNMFSYQGLILAWLPRVDGVFLTEPPQVAVLRGHVANVPMITGNCDDEGSLFSFSSSNVTQSDSTTAELKTYMKTYMMSRAKDNDMSITLGPQFKRIAALQGDFVFHGPRRLLLQNVAGRQKSWGFIHKRGKDIPYVGAVWTPIRTDLVNSFGMLDEAAPSELRDNIIWFTNNLDPNGPEPEVTWPQWDPRDPKALVFRDGLLPRMIIDDNYRTDALMFMRNISLLNPI